MACVMADGSLSPAATTILTALRESPATAADLVQRTSLALYRIRGSLRELGAAQLLEELPDGRFQITPAGAKKLAR